MTYIRRQLGTGNGAIKEKEMLPDPASRSEETRAAIVCLLATFTVRGGGLHRTPVSFAFPALSILPLLSFVSFFSNRGNQGAKCTGRFIYELNAHA